MSIFLHCAAFLDCDETEVKAAIAEAAKDDSMELVPDECEYQTQPNGVRALLNDYCRGYEPLARKLSELLHRPVMVLYMYDSEFWGYYFYENGRELDSFNPVPNMLGNVPETERERLKGRPEVLASYFRVDEGRLKRYLRFWTKEMYEVEDVAYPGDAYAAWEGWQIIDFMKAIGFPYD